MALLTEVELIMNDRPLITASDNVNDVQPLTPNKLLLLRKLSTRNIFER